MKKIGLTIYALNVFHTGKYHIEKKQGHLTFIDMLSAFSKEQGSFPAPVLVFHETKDAEVGFRKAKIESHAALLHNRTAFLFHHLFLFANPVLQLPTLHIMCIVSLQIVSKHCRQIRVICLIYTDIEILRCPASFCHTARIKMLK